MTASKEDDLHQKVRVRLAGEQVRYTATRHAVVASLLVASGPQSTAELTARLDDIPLSSLYRSLTVLTDGGVLRRHHDADGVARFELAEWLTGHHHHLVCVGCGVVEDITVDASTEAVLDELAGRLASQAGFQPVGHNLEVEGRCRLCRG